MGLRVKPKLITGGTGIIGSELARLLVSRGEEVVVFDIASDRGTLEDIKDKVSLVRGDLANWPEVANVVRNYDIEGIYHLGAMLSVSSDANPWASFQVNVVGSFNVLEAARLFGVKKVVFTSSIGTFGLETGEILTDTAIQRPVNMYGVGKLFCEGLGRFYRNKFGLDFRSIRYPGIVCPGVHSPGVGQYNTWMIERAVNGEPFECFVSEDTCVPTMYFKDAARAADIAYETPTDRIQMVNYNVAGITPPLTAKELEITISKYYPGARVTYKPNPEIMRFFSIVNYRFFDDGFAKSELGWKPAYPNFDEVIHDFAKEMKDHPGRYGLD